MRPAIEVRAIGQRTCMGGVTLRDVSLAIGDGELAAIIGGSGSGKTTLLDAMSGLRPPATGTVLRPAAAQAGPAPRPGTPQAGPVPPSRHPHAHRHRHTHPYPRSCPNRHFGHIGNVGYVPAADALHPALPLARALRYAAGLRAAASRGPASTADAVAGALRTTGLTSQAATPVGALDAGQRKRAAIAAELLPAPSLLFLEEPTTGLDPAQGTEVMCLLRRLCDAGTTVVLTTQNPLDAARCDKVAVLATGGHLAFFGTPEGACDYFAADSLDEIYQRLAGLGDPAATWSRRFFHLSRTIAGVSSITTMPPGAGPPVLLPDWAGPHSAGPVTIDRSVTAPGAGRSAAPAGTGRGAGLATTGRPADPARTDRAAAPVTAGRSTSSRQLAILLARNTDVLARCTHARLTLACVPVALLLMFLALLGAGALNGPDAVSLAWAAVAALAVGAAYGCTAVSHETGVLRRERFAGLSATLAVLAKAVILAPALAAADAIIIAVPAISGRLPGGFAAAYLTALIPSALALAVILARLVISTTPNPLPAPFAAQHPNSP